MRLARITGPKGGAGDRLLVARQAPSSAAVQNKPWAHLAQSFPGDKDAATVRVTIE